VQIFNVDISAALIDTFVTAYLPALAEKSGERLKHGGRKSGVMLFGSFRGPFLTAFSDMDNWFPSGPLGELNLWPKRKTIPCCRDTRLTRTLWRG
jgi:hypothetical protein